MGCPLVRRRLARRGFLERQDTGGGVDAPDEVQHVAAGAALDEIGGAALDEEAEALLEQHGRADLQHQGAAHRGGVGERPRAHVVDHRNVWIGAETGSSTIDAPASLHSADASATAARSPEITVLPGALCEAIPTTPAAVRHSLRISARSSP